ncbi:MAG: FkbM family methyltransferase [Gemmatales bacterium]
MLIQYQPGWRTALMKKVLGCEKVLHPRLFRLLLGMTWPLARNAAGRMPVNYGKLPLQYNLQDPAERQGWLGIYDPPLTQLLQKFCLPGMTMIDVGANIGIVSSSVADQLGETGFILLVEPNPSLAKRLREFAENNPLKNMHVAELAVDVKTGTLPFYVSSAHTYSTLVKAQLPDYPLDSVVNVSVVRLADVIARVPADRHIHVLKLDAEGVDLNVMLDVLPTIAEKQIDLLIVEAFGKQVDEVIQKYQTIGYSPWAIEESTRQLRPWGTVPAANCNLVLTLRNDLTQPLTGLS